MSKLAKDLRYKWLNRKYKNLNVVRLVQIEGITVMTVIPVSINIWTDMKLSGTFWQENCRNPDTGLTIGSNLLDFKNIGPAVGNSSSQNQIETNFVRGAKFNTVI